MVKDVSSCLIYTALENLSSNSFLALHRNLFTHEAFRNSKELVFKMSVRSGSNWNLEVQVFEDRTNPDYPEKDPSRPDQGRESTTNSTNIWRRRQHFNPGHIGGRRVLSLLHHPCSSKSILGTYQLFDCTLERIVHYSLTHCLCSVFYTTCETNL